MKPKQQTVRHVSLRWVRAGAENMGIIIYPCSVEPFSDVIIIVAVSVWTNTPQLKKQQALPFVSDGYFHALKKIVCQDYAWH